MIKNSQNTKTGHFLSLQRELAIVRKRPRDGPVGMKFANISITVKKITRTFFGTAGSVSASYRRLRDVPVRMKLV